MAAWSGWITDLLAAAKLPYTQGNQTWMGDWHNSADSNCKNNPVDISRGATGATNCHKLTGTRTAKNYRSHGSAQTAFNGQLRSGNFPHLLAALKSGDPYGVAKPADVITDLEKWGSLTFAFELTQNYGPPHGQPPPPSGNIKAPQVHTGWRDLQHSFNSHMRQELDQAHRTTNAALRTLQKARKVRL